MYKLCFYVPATHVDSVKDAIFAAGAGRVGDYDSSAWQELGEGQFPFIGQQGQIEKVPEYKVEAVCEDAVMHAVVAALKAAHPYEEPAYQVWRLESF